MEELMEILKGMRPDVDFEKETGLITDGILDSFDVISLVSELNDTFDIEIGSGDMVPANFNSAAAIYEMVKRLEDD